MAARAVGNFILNVARLAAFGYICYIAYNIRLHAVNDFGPVIHEFDPYFNFRLSNDHDAFILLVLLVIDIRHDISVKTYPLLNHEIVF